jgi:OOP family OmpA-OmpF porin
VAVLLTGCAGVFGQYDVDALNKATPSGDAFSAALTSEYRTLANFEWNEMADWKSGQHYAKKGLAAAGGKSVGPDEVAAYRLPDFAVGDITNARARLLEKLDGGARESKAEAAAKAQAKLDCWMEQQAENHQPDDIAACRNEFEAAYAQLGTRYTVFFDTGSAVITKAGAKIIAEAVKEAKKAGFNDYVVVGHTDTQGKTKYNETLSKKRAAAVKAALTKHGVSAKKITTSATGETKLMVETADGVKEPSNRRVEISVQ